LFFQGDGSQVETQKAEGGAAMEVSDGVCGGAMKKEGETNGTTTTTNGDGKGDGPATGEEGAGANSVEANMVKPLGTASEGTGNSLSSQVQV